MTILTSVGVTITMLLIVFVTIQCIRSWFNDREHNHCNRDHEPHLLHTGSYCVDRRPGCEKTCAIAIQNRNHRERSANFRQRHTDCDSVRVHNFQQRQEYGGRDSRL